MTPRDPDLEQRFEDLRRSDARRAGDFETAWQAARRLPPTQGAGRAWRAAFAAALAVLALGVALNRWMRPRPGPAELSRIMEWRAPSDSLLATPGGELLRSTPRLGEPLSSPFLMDSGRPIAPFEERRKQ